MDIKILRVVMPSVGDCELLQQEGGTVDLRPIFFKTEAIGPHLQIVTGTLVDGKFIAGTVQRRYRLKIFRDGRLQLLENTDDEVVPVQRINRKAAPPAPVVAPPAPVVPK